MKILKKIHKAYRMGFLFSSVYVFWYLKFFFLRFFKVKKVQSRYGVKLYSDFYDVTFQLYFLASYGFFYSEFLKNYPSKFIFLDVGANKGLFTILAAKNLSCKKVISFEPVPLTYEFLKKNTVLNNIFNKCELHNLAISNSCGEKKITFDRNHSGLASLAFKNDNEDFLKIRTVNKVLLDDLISSKNKNYILKIDVEGFEYTVINELFKCKFSEAITNIFYEIDERWVDPFLIEKILRDNGFKKFQKIGDKTHYDVMATK